MACDPRCLSWYSDDPANAHDCRDTHGHTPRPAPRDPVAEGRRDNAAHRATRHARNGPRP